MTTELSLCGSLSGGHLSLLHGTVENSLNLRHSVEQKCLFLSSSPCLLRFCLHSGGAYTASQDTPLPGRTAGCSPDSQLLDHHARQGPPSSVRVLLQYSTTPAPRPCAPKCKAVGAAARWLVNTAWVSHSFPSQALNILYFTNRWRCFPPLRS